MSEALRTAENLPPEAIALIREGTPKPRVSAGAISTVKTQEEKTAERAPALPEPVSSAEAKIETAPPAASQSGESNEARSSKLRVVREREPEPIASNALVSMTFRVPSDLPSALVRASADRKAKRIRPFTQQEIVADALGQWLKRNGYETERH
jgi:hypothetical protein